MATEAWLQQLHHVTEKTTQYISYQQKKKKAWLESSDKDKDPKEFEKLQEKINWACTLFHTKMASIEAKIDLREQMAAVQKIRSISCAG